jgi:hypothetical protein
MGRRNLDRRRLVRRRTPRHPRPLADGGQIGNSYFAFGSAPGRQTIEIDFDGHLHQVPVSRYGVWAFIKTSTSPGKPAYPTPNGLTRTWGHPQFSLFSLGTSATRIDRRLVLSDAPLALEGASSTAAPCTLALPPMVVDPASELATPPVAPDANTGVEGELLVGKLLQAMAGRSCTTAAAVGSARRPLLTTWSAELSGQATPLVAAHASRARTIRQSRATRAAASTMMMPAAMPWKSQNLLTGW